MFRRMYSKFYKNASTKSLYLSGVLTDNCGKTFSTCDALRDLVPFVQFKKREKHPWKSVVLRERFSRFLTLSCIIL